jgi:hypothetical protein
MDAVLLRKSLGKLISKGCCNANFYRLSETAKQRRLQWALEHAHWTTKDWENVI